MLTNKQQLQCVVIITQICTAFEQSRTVYVITEDNVQMRA